MVVFQLPHERVRLDELVRSAIEQVELEAADLDVDLAPIEAAVAPVKYERIVVNLVANASIHTPPGTSITVRLRGADGGALLVVADEGPGVPPEHHEAVFDPFWQGLTVPSHRPGTGIGLSLVAAFTELHRGRYSVKDAPGGGAEFHVWVPLRHEASGGQP